MQFLHERQLSVHVFQQAQTILPGGVNSPARAFKHVNLPPLVVSKAQADLLYDVDGHEYIDYCGAWGIMLLGHQEPLVVDAVHKQLSQGICFGLLCEAEVKLGQIIQQAIPSLELIRFTVSGMEATSAAIRAARAYTKKRRIIQFIGNYHGASDPFLQGSGSQCAQVNVSGVPFSTDTLLIPYNDIDQLSQCLELYESEIAAVIIEPVAMNMGVVPATIEFLQLVRQLTEEKNIVLIFDEVITGFRLGFSAQHMYGIYSDLTCLGKIIGGGFPVAAFGGKKAIMQHVAPLGPCFHGGTYAGHPVGMVAGYATIQACDPLLYQTLESKTDIIVNPIQAYIQSHDIPVCLHRVGSCFSLFFGHRSIHNFQDVTKCDRALFQEYYHTLFEQGIFFSPSPFEANFVSAAHTQAHLIQTQEAILKFLKQKF